MFLFLVTGVAVNDYSCIVRTNLERRSDRWSAASQIICLIACRMPADALNWRFQGQTAKCFRINRVYSSGCLGIGAEVFGVFGEAEAGLSDPLGGESAEFVGG